MRWISPFATMKISSLYLISIEGYSKSEYTLESVSMSGRPAVYAIISERFIRSS